MNKHKEMGNIIFNECGITKEDIRAMVEDCVIKTVNSKINNLNVEEMFVKAFKQVLQETLSPDSKLVSGESLAQAIRSDIVTAVAGSISLVINENIYDQENSELKVINVRRWCKEPTVQRFEIINKEDTYEMV